MRNLRWVNLTLVFAMCTSLVVAEIKIPELKQRVSDFTNTLSFQEWQEIDRLLKSYEDTASTQVVVLMVNTLDGESIEEYANKTFTLNKIGQAKKDKGVLFVISKQDHKVRIEVGYGLEGVLTDAVCSQIIRQEILPHFKADNYFGGIVTGVDAIVRATKGEYQIEKGKKAPAVYMGLLVLVLVIIFVVAVMVPFLLTLQKAANRCSPEIRTMNPKSVWLLLVPVFGFIWQFNVVYQLSASLDNEFKRRGIIDDSKPSKKIGTAYCILNILNIIPYVGIVTSIPCLICLIIYWRKIARYSAEIAVPYRIV